MNAMDFSGPVGMILGLLLIVWAVLMFFAPFFWYGAWYRAKQSHLELVNIRIAIDEANMRRQS